MVEEGAKFLGLSFGFFTLISTGWYRIRMVRPFATAHTFCAPRDGQKSSYFLVRCVLIQRYFFAVYNYAGKEDLSKY